MREINKWTTFEIASVHFQLVQNIAAIKEKKKFDRFIEIRTGLTKRWRQGQVNSEKRTKKKKA